MEAASIRPEITKVKALVAALEGVDINKAIKEASIQQVAVAAAPAAAGGGAKAEAKPEAKKEDEKKAAEEAAAGLSALFG